MKRKSKPNWWIPFSFVPLMIIALLLESQIKYAVEIHEIVDSGIVIATFGLMVGWVGINAQAIAEQDSTKEQWIFIEEPYDDKDFKIEMPTDLTSERTQRLTVQPTTGQVGLRDSDSLKSRYN